MDDILGDEKRENGWGKGELEGEGEGSTGVSRRGRGQERIRSSIIRSRHSSVVRWFLSLKHLQQ